MEKLNGNRQRDEKFCIFINEMLEMWSDKSLDERMQSSFNYHRYYANCNCGKMGHMKATCRILEKKDFKNRTNAINEDEENIQDDNLCVLNVMKVNKAIKVSMLIEDEKVEFILDTGYPVTILSEKMGMMNRTK